MVGQRGFTRHRIFLQAFRVVSVLFLSLLIVEAFSVSFTSTSGSVNSDSVSVDQSLLVSNVLSTVGARPSEQWHANQQPSLQATKSPSVQPSKNCSTSQKTINALEDFYNAAGGPNWVYPVNASGVEWDFTQSNPDPCQQHWQGIQCNSDCGVVAIYLPGYNLIGTITSSINQLASTLSALVLSKNPSLGGALPINLYTLTNLLVLDLHDDSFSGSILYNLVNLQSLMVLNLYNNHFVGSLPSSFGSLTSLQFVDLHNNAFSGQLPSNLGSISPLTYFDASYNNFNGPFPTSISSLTHLETFIASGNSITGSMSSNLGVLKKLTVFDITDNIITGSFPSGWNSSNLLSEWRVANNKIKGSINTDFYQCLQLSIIDMSNNKLTGQIEPSSSSLLSNLQNLTEINLAYNFMSGTLPQSLLSLSSLKVLLLSDNFFHGVIPTNIGNTLTALTNLTLTFNYFTGPFPASLFDVRALTSISLGANTITGTLSLSVGNLNQLTELALFDTHMTGSIPSTLSALQELATLDLHSSFFDGELSPLPFCTKLTSVRLDNNDFSGVIPSNFNILNRLEFLRLDNNHISGIIPANLLNTPKLQYLNVSTNKLIGSIPQSLAQAVELEVLDVSNNALNGTLGTMISGLTKLSVLYANNNKLTGNLYGLVPSSSSLDVTNGTLGTTHYQVLSQVDISNNQISGSIPVALFQMLPNLTALNLMKNCLTGSLSSSYCAATGLQALVLDGIHSADSCQYHVVRNEFKHYDSDNFYISKPLGGTIPACLFTLPKIQTIHLAGNGVEGTLPHSLTTISSTLLDLTICHNQLTSSIPEAIQVHSFRYLDLSYNRFYGSLNANFDPTAPSSSPSSSPSLVPTASAFLELEMNRLSGSVPSTLLNIGDINILHGNMFACEVTEESSQLPDNDQYKHAYECGSNNVDNTFYAWLIFMAFCALFVLLIRVAALQCQIQYALGLIQSFQESLFLYWEVYNSKLTALFYNKNINYLHEYGDNLMSLRKWSMVYTITVALIFMPLYVAFTFFNSTYTNTYIWQVSLGFLTGEEPTIITIILFALIVIVFDLKNGFVHIEMFLPKQMSLLLLNHVMNARPISVDSVVGGNLGAPGVGTAGMGIGIGPRSTTIGNDPRDRLESTADATQGTGATVITSSTLTSSRSMASRSKSCLYRYLCCLKANDINWYCSLLFYIVLNFAVIIPITVGLVYAAVTPVDRSLTTFYSFLYAMAIIYWDDVVLPNYVARWLSNIYKHYYPVDTSSAATAIQANKHANKPPVPLMINDPYAPKPVVVASDQSVGSQSVLDVLTLKQLEQQRTNEADSRIVQLLSILMIINSIAIPVIIVAILSPDCFYNAVSTPDQEEVSIIYNVCNSLSTSLATLIERSTFLGETIPCVVTHTSFYTPPYYYRYQCSSRFLTIFTPIYLYRFFFAGFLLPMFQLFMKIIQEYLAIEYGADTKLIPYINVFLPSILIPLSDRARKSNGAVISHMAPNTGGIPKLGGVENDSPSSGITRSDTTNTDMAAVVEEQPEAVVNIDDSYGHPYNEEDEEGDEDDDGEGDEFSDDYGEGGVFNEGEEENVGRPSSHRQTFEIESQMDSQPSSRSNSRPSSQRISDRFSFGIVTRLSEGLSLSNKPGNNMNTNITTNNTFANATTTTRGSFRMSLGNNSFSVSNSFHQQVNIGNNNNNNNHSISSNNQHHSVSYGVNISHSNSLTGNAMQYAASPGTMNASYLSSSLQSNHMMANNSIVSGVSARNQRHTSNEVNSQRSESAEPTRTISLGSERTRSIGLESVDFSHDERGSLHSVAFQGSQPSVTRHGGQESDAGLGIGGGGGGFGGRIRETIARRREAHRNNSNNKKGNNKRKRRPIGNNRNNNGRSTDVNQYDQLFDSRGIAISLLHDIVLMFTFGTLFPPLCIVACCVIVIKTLYQQLLLGRLVVLSRNNKNKVLQGFVKHIDQECGKIRARIRDSSYFVPLFATLIWAFFLFDVYGNSEGYLSAMWVMCIVAVPIALFTIRQAKLYYRSLYPLPDDVDGDEDDRKSKINNGKDIEDGTNVDTMNSGSPNGQRIGGSTSPVKKDWRDRQESDNSIRASGMFLRASQRFSFSPAALGMNGYPTLMSSPYKQSPAMNVTPKDEDGVVETTVNPMATLTDGEEKQESPVRSESTLPSTMELEEEGLDDVEFEDMN